MLKFGYTDWVMNNLLVLIIITIPTSFVLIYKIVETKVNYFIKGLFTIGIIILTFVIIPSIGYMLFLDEYINEFREEFKEYVENEGRYSLEVENVEITNNNGNHIPKFSTNDEDMYVKIHYDNNRKNERRIVKSEPVKSYDDKYRLTFVFVDEDYEIKTSKYEEIIFKIRELLGFKDKDKMNFRKGAYDFELEVPEKDFRDVKSEMKRKEK